MMIGFKPGRLALGLILLLACSGSDPAFTQDRRQILDEIPIVIFYDPDRYASGVYDLRVGEQTPITLENTTEGFLATDEKGGKWNMLTGAGPKRQQLQTIPHMQIYWFAWSDFYPETLLFEHKKARD